MTARTALLSLATAETGLRDTLVAIVDELEGLQRLVSHLREEADFNRSWTDGRRGVSTELLTDDYKARRIELAVEREQWAASVERLARLDPAVIARRLRSIVGAMWSEAYCNDVAATLVAKEGE